MAKSPPATLEVAGREVRVSNPDKVYFPGAGVTKLQLCEYYVAVADAAVLHLRDRPTVLKRYVDGITGEPFFQKRLPQGAPDWVAATARFAGPFRPTAAWVAGRVAETAYALS